ncbi:MAG: GatB/YqeY domain-containing protein [Patescibacteria group bacterium]|nr:GatB/YqeY domain-containing protein [Patescibacteria group bacterium]
MLKQQIEEEIKAALKSGDQVRLSTLRLVLSAIKNLEIDKHSEATDEDVIVVVQKQIKQRKEAIELYRKGGREDLAAKEEAELSILNKFIPQQLSEPEIKKVVEEVRAGMPETEKNNFGKVMALVMARVKGKAEGNLVGKVVKESLV